MSTNTSIGPDGSRGGNEDHGNADGCGNKTLGDKSEQQQPPAGADVLDEAGAQVPAGVPGARPRPGIGKGPQSFPDGPNVEDSPWEPEAARGNPPGQR
jgi:hypothetical protein